jgi:uncharacterized protein YbaP (TraB family)
MRYFILAFLFNCVGIQNVLAQDTDSVQKPLLWKIQGEKAHYLFGTIHIPDPRVTTLPALVTQAIASSDVVVTEIALDRNTVKAAAQGMVLAPEQTLSKLLDPKLIHHINAELHLINSALTLTAFERLKPWAFAASLPMLSMQMKYAGAPALDILLAENAVAAGKRNEGLETVQEQLQVFDGMSQQQQIRLLAYTVKEMQKDRAEGGDLVEEMTQTYLSGDEIALNILINNWMISYEDADDLNKRLLTDRNNTMANRLEHRLRTQPKETLFVAIGAGHLTGEGNVITLLRKRGFIIERVLK